MSYYRNLNLLFVSEELVIVHLARNESVGTRLNRPAQQERAGSAAYRHPADVAFQQLVGLHALYVEAAFQHPDKLLCRHRLLQRADYSAAAFRLFVEESHIRKPHFLGYLEVHTTRRIVQIRVHGHYRHVVLYGLAHCPLHVVFAGDMRQFAEYQRMMSHDEVAAVGHRLVHDFLGYVKTQQCP